MDLDQALSLVQRPSRYLGTEFNARRTPWEEAELRIALIFPDLYEIGMSHLGLHILYHILGDIPGILVDRAYCPDRDLEHLLQSRKMPLWGLESRRPLRDFDVLAITLPYELCYSNILTLLDCAGIPLQTVVRDASWPVVLGGGSGALHAEPVADFFDAILVGDGEEAGPEIAACVGQWRAAGGAKEELLAALAQVEGVYVPSLYRPRYGADGAFLALEPRVSGVGTVRRRIVSELTGAPFPARPLVPFLQIVHDRLGLEIARGCTRGCRFCQAGIVYRPVRERDPNEVLDLLERALAASGWEEISLLSLSTGDYSCLLPLLTELMDRHVPDQVAVSLPSLRVGTLTKGVMEQIKRVRKTAFTLAPEAGSERLRRVINKGIAEQDLLATAAQAFALGWPLIKLYFMTGLPTETTADVRAIADLARGVLASGGRGSRGRQVTVSVGTFVPKPHTAFQWEHQISVAESQERLVLLKERLRGRGLSLKWHDPWQSYLEGVFSRGDRRLARVLVRAWEMGARLDAWGDKARPGLYLRAAAELGVDLDAYLAARDQDAPLPWDHVETGVRRIYLKGERERAWEGSLTSDCRWGECQGCGACDFDRVRPVVHDRESISPRARPLALSPSGAAHGYHLVFSRLREARFLSHLEVVHALYRAARRCRLPLAFSAGFHPKPRFSFGPPVPVGTESLGEQWAVVLVEPVQPADLMARLNSELPSGLRVVEAGRANPGAGLVTPEEVTYLIAAPDPLTDLYSRLAALAKAATWPVVRVRKGKERLIDLKEIVADLAEASPIHLPLLPSEDGNDEGAVQWPDGGGAGLGPVICATLRNVVSGGLRPAEVVGEILGLGERDRLRLRVLKLWAPHGGAIAVVAEEVRKERGLRAHPADGVLPR